MKRCIMYACVLIVSHTFAPSHRLPQDNSVQDLCRSHETLASPVPFGLQRPRSPVVHPTQVRNRIERKCPTFAAEGTVITSLTPSFSLFYTPSSFSFLSVYPDRD